MINAFAAPSAGARLEPFSYDPGALGSDEVELQVEHCGLCHSDLSMLNNDWGMTRYPFVGGHEVVGRVTAVGSEVRHLKAGQRAGLGWFSGSCLSCRSCVGGDQNLCADRRMTVVGRHGGFANRVRAQGAWVLPLPEGLAADQAGPLFCGGITVFNAIVQADVRPTQRAAVVGIGGLGHLAVQFLRAWGCEVTACSTSPDKAGEAKRMGAHNFVATRDPESLVRLADSLDFILVTVNVPLDWQAYINILRARGRLHLVGLAPDPSLPAAAMIGDSKTFGASPVGSPAVVMDMLEFCARHKILPVTEHFPMSDINAAVKHLEAGKARYRIVLSNDLD